MKNYLIIILLFLGLLAGNAISAQDFHGYRASKKNWKMHKKEGKIGRKMFRDRPRQAARKKYKATKKEYKREEKDAMHK